jgi:hypothetical protein
MELQIGDRLTDETGKYEIIGRPFTTNARKDVHARVNRLTSRTHRDANPGRARARQREAGRAGRGRLGFHCVGAPRRFSGTRGDPVRELVQILLAVG